MNNKLFIYSEPIQSGKTSALFNWVQHQNANGILTPDVNGLRKLYDVSGKTYHDLQIPDDAEGIKIGRFTFDKQVMQHARKLIDKSLQQQPDWIIIDEIGRLELNQNAGLEPAIGELINTFKQQYSNTKLLLVIRDYLLDDAVKHYQLNDDILLSRSFFERTAKPLPPLNGLVLCGGKSTRMQRDKALITYFDKPQYAHVAGLISAFCSKVYVSCRVEQQQLINHYPCITDNMLYQNKGPIAGVISAFEQLPQHGLMVIACDYPYLTFDDVTSLFEARTPKKDVVCYKNTDSGFAEPLIAVYEQQCFGKLKYFFDKGDLSLRLFLNECNTAYIQTDNTHLKSVDE